MIDNYTSTIDNSQHAFPSPGLRKIDSRGKNRMDLNGFGNLRVATRTLARTAFPALTRSSRSIGDDRHAMGINPTSLGLRKK